MVQTITRETREAKERPKHEEPTKIKKGEN